MKSNNLSSKQLNGIHSPTISPGASPGLLSISGKYTERAGAHLQIELGGTTPGTGYDQLSVGGSAALAGTLDVSYCNGFTPGPGNVFTVLVCTAHRGGFSSIQAPDQHSRRDLYYQECAARNRQCLPHGPTGGGPPANRLPHVPRSGLSR